MKYTELIKENEGFKYSINIQYDLNNKNKISGYIPTSNSIKILKYYLENLKLSNSDRATVLVGPYGKGKSHLLLILLALMNCNENDELNKLIEKIKIIDEECFKLAEDVLKNKKYLPVILNFNSDELNQAFLIAMKEALKRDGKDDILPETYFEAAFRVIEGWENHENKSNFNKLKKLLKEEGIKLTEFKNKLKLYNKESYDIFKVMFEKITSGVEFNPLFNTDIVKFIEECNYNLKEQYGYDGIIIVFDEFSKFIEASKEKNNAKDLKILQDLAELSDRSNTPQLHLVCITHKTINEYIRTIPQEKIDAWRAIEGRFKEITFDSSLEQNYELISNAILKDKEKFNEFLNKNEKKLRDLTEEQIRLYSNVYNKEEYYEKIVKGCFPLNPYTTFALPIVSEKVAQNERTLFTYLNKEEPHSLISIMKKLDTKNVSLVELYTLYDYFEDLFRKETFNEKIYNIWFEVNVALKIVEGTEEEKLKKIILKTLGVIYIIDDFSTISPSDYNLKNILDVEENKLKEVLDILVQEAILIFRESTELYDFMPLSTINVQKDIDNMAETTFNNPDIQKDLSEILSLKFILPKRYNDKYKITRFFRRVFITIQELLAYNNSEKIIKNYKADGIIIDLIYFDKNDIERAKEWLNNIKDNRIVLVIPEKGFSILKDLSKYEAIEKLKANINYLNKDNGVLSQLEIIEEDLKLKISKYIEKNYNIYDKYCKVFMKGNLYRNLSSQKMSLYLSEICDDNFYLTPVINNEMINKNSISTPIKKARNEIIESILNKSYTEFEYNKNSAEATLFRATLVNKGLVNKKDVEDKGMVTLLDIIKEYLKKAEKNEIKFEDLYNALTSNERKLGVRKGVIPIYLSYVLKDYNEEIILYLKSGRSRREINLDVENLNVINESPENYTFKIEKGTTEKNDYINNISSMFEDYFSQRKSGNKFVDIVQAMKNWFNSLSIYTTNYMLGTDDKKIDKTIINFRNEIKKFEINNRNFLFKDLLKILEVENYSQCIDKLKYVKETLDRHIEEVKKYISNEVKNIFDEKYNGNFIGAMKNWFNNLENDKKTYLFDKNTKKLIDLLQKMQDNSVINIDSVSQIFTGLLIEDWSDQTEDLFFSELKNSKEEIDNLEIEKEENNNTVKIIVKDKDEKEVEKIFNMKEISAVGHTLLNSIDEAIEEYGDSVDENEKRIILMNILQRYI